MVNPIRSAFSVEGEDEPLFLIHGIGASRASFAGLVPHLRKEFRVISYDLRGHGVSPTPAPPYTLDDLVEDLEALRALVYRAVSLYLKGEDVTTLASMAKLKAGRLGRTVPDACLQFWGGMGYTWDNPVSRSYRDARLTSIGGGADEVMLSIIAKRMGVFSGK